MLVKFIDRPHDAAADDDRGEVCRVEQGADRPHSLQWGLSGALAAGTASSLVKDSLHKIPVATIPGLLLVQTLMDTYVINFELIDHTACVVSPPLHCSALHPDSRCWKLASQSRQGKWIPGLEI